MDYKLLLKNFILVLYSSVIVIVPPMPHIYTLIVDCLGFLVATIACIFLIYFLCTRPSSQKNILNRVIICIAVSIILALVRSLGISIAAYFWNSQLQTLLETYETLAILLSYRLTSIVGTYCFLALCSCRLLLVTNPVVFQAINPKSGVIAICSVISSVCVLDFFYGGILCSGTVYTRKVMMNFKVEIGAWTELNGTVFSQGANNTKDPRFCFHIPIVALNLAAAVILEIVKLVFAFIQEYRKLVRNKFNKIQPFIMKPTPKAREFRARSVSLSSCIQSNSRPRRGSLPTTLIRSNLNNVLAAAPIVHQVNPPSIDMVEIRNIVVNITKTFCLRAGSFLTIFAVVACLCLILPRFMLSSFTLIGQLTSFRLTIYVLIVYLVVMDKDIFNFIMQKLKF